MRKIIFTSLLLMLSHIPAFAVPDVITNLTATRDLQLKLTWTAPDNGSGGACTSYLVKYSTTADITSDAEFDQATTLEQAWAPATPGVTEISVLTGLIPETTYWFSIKSYYNGLWSIVSATGTNAAVSGALCNSGQDFTGVYSCSLAWGDYDNDGYPDLAISGFTGSSRYSRVYHNNRDGTFANVADLTGASGSALAWGDYDNDGYLDLALSGNDASLIAFARIYHNDGNGNFSYAVGLPGVYSGSFSWGDYDNDGDLDLAMSGNTDASHTITRIYRNDGDNSFVDAVPGLAGSDSLAWGDYNNDGYLDLAVAGGSWNTIIYRNKGDGTFINSVTGLTGVSDAALVWGDYDNDGCLDLAVAGSRTTKIYRNRGDGTFQDAIPGLTGVQFPAVAWGDYDMDGDLDLAVSGNAGGQRVAKIYRNNGSSFSESDGLPGVENGSLAWGDYDNDGDLDLVFAGNDSASTRYMRIYRSMLSEGGRMQTPPGTPDPGTGASFDTVTGRLAIRWDRAVDAQTDGKGLYYAVRVATEPIDDSLGRWIVSPSSGAGATPFFGNYPHGYCVASSTQPGLNLKPCVTGVTYYWQVRAIDPGFQYSSWTQTQSYYLPVQIPWKITDLVVSRDYQLKLAWTAPHGGTGDEADGYVVKYSTTGDIATEDEFAQATTFYQSWSPVVPGSPESKILTGLIPETTYWFAIKSYFNAAWSLVSSTGTNSAKSGSFAINASTFTGASDAAVAWGDYNNDGYIDVAVSGSDFTKIYRNKGNGTFTEVTMASLQGAKKSTLAWGDFDNDGLLDLALCGVVGVTYSYVYIYRNNGNGTFTNINAGDVYVPRFYNKGSLCWGDYNNDGYLDLAVVSIWGTKIYKNAGGSAFIDSGASFPSLSDSSIAFGDYDNDGYLDLALAGYTGSQGISQVYRNNGDGTFTKRADLDGSGFRINGSPSLCWGDYDNDGYLDLAQNGRLYHNNGDGTFSDIGAAISGRHLSWGDFDNDGYLDLLSEGTKVYRNNGNNTFAAWDVCLSSYAGAAVWGDCDNDGDLDVVFSGNGVTKAFLSCFSESGRPNFPPQPLQTGLSSEYDYATDTLKLRWDRANDAATLPGGLYYDIAVATKPITGSLRTWLVSPSTGAGATPFMGTYPHGYCTVSSTQPGLNLSVKLLDTTYYWQVGARDAGLARSTWSAQQSLFVPVPALDVTSIAPSTASYYGSVDTATIMGMGFLPGATVTLKKGGSPDIAAGNVRVINLRTITCSFDLLNATTGCWDLVVDRGDQSKTVSEGFAVLPPDVSQVTPSSACYSGPATVTISGHGFVPGMSVRLRMAGEAEIPGAGTSVADSEHIISTFNVTGRTTGYWDVVISTGGAGGDIAHKVGGLRVYEMRVSSMTPAAAYNNDPVTVLHLAGEGFVKGSTARLAKMGEQDIPATALTVVNASSITCSFDITGKTTGYWDVVVGTGGAGSISAVLSDGFKVNGMSSPAFVIGAEAGVDIELRKGMLCLVWNNNGTVKFNKSTDGGNTWNNTANVSTSVSGDPAVALDDSGNIYVVYNRGGSVYCSRSSDGGRTFPVERQVITGVNQYTDIVIRSGSIYVGSANNRNVFCSSTTVSEFVFGSSVTVDTGGGFYTYIPRLAASDNGQNVYVTYNGDFPTLHRVLLKRSTDYGATFGARLDLIEGYGSYGQCIAAAGESNLYVAYYGDHGSGRYKRYIKKSENAGGSFATCYSENAVGIPYSLAAFGNKVLFSCTSADGVQYFTTNNRGVTWGAKNRADTGSVPRAAMSERGEGVLVYNVNTGSGYTIKTTSVALSVQDLTALSGEDSGSINLCWTMPAGPVSRFDLRYSTVTLDEFNYFSGTAVANIPADAPAGQQIGPFPVGGLMPDVTYYFALKNVNMLDQYSNISNVSFAVPYNLDISSPCAVTDLAAEGLPFAFRLSWTAPGDNGHWFDLAPPSDGGYILKYSTNIIASESDFQNAAEYPQSWAPKGTGQKETRMVTGLDMGRRYYFALKAYDDGQNVSPLSNVADAAASGISLGDIYPKAGTNNGSRVMVFCGLGFENGMTAKLKRAGKTDIGAVSVSVNSVFCASITFNLSNVASGLWDVEVAKGTQTATLPGAFFVNNPEPAGSGWSWDKKTIGLYYGTLDIAAADLDGDGVSEIYSVDGGTVTRSTSDGKTWTKTVMAVEGVNQVRKLGVGDADNDGKCELYAGGAGNLFMYKYSPSGWIRTVVSGMADVRSIVVADADNDGLRELYCADGGEIYRVKVIGLGQVEKDSLPKPAGVASWSSAMRFTVGDGDGDGKTELYIGDSSTNLCLYRLSFDGVSWNYSLIEGRAAYSLVVCDADNDGVQELYATVNDGQSRLCRYRYAGSSWEKTVLLNRYSDSLISVDADGDGAAEIYGRTSGVTGTKFNGSAWSDTVLDNWGTLVKLVTGDAMGEGSLGLYAFYSNKNGLFQFKRRTPPRGGFSRSFAIYNDAGSLRAPGVYQGNSGSLALSSDYSTAAEGAYSMKAHVASPLSSSWAGTYIDGSLNMYDYYYNGGSLKFSIRFSSPPPANLVIGMRSDNQIAGYENSKVYLSNYLASPSSNTWYAVTIPLQDFYAADQNLDFNRMAVFFNLAYTGPACGGVWEGDIWFDDVSWVQPDFLDRIDIIPAAASLYPGSRRTFTPLYYNRFGDPVVSTSVPHWSISGGAGEVSPADGPCTVFIADPSAGNGDTAFVVCQAGGKTAAALVTISTQTWAQSYEIYDDTGIPYGSNIYTWEADGNVSITEVTDAASAPEGIRYTRQTVDSAYGGWGVVFSTTTKGGVRDLSEYNGGNLEFRVKTPVNLKVEMQESDEAGLKKSVYIGSYGWDSTNTWQEISIPVSDFLINGGIDLSKVHSPFLITAETPCTFEVDGVRLVTNVTNQGPAKVQLIGKQLYVDGRPFVVKGVCGEFVPPGGNATYDWSLDPNNYARDIPLLKAMGANVIRLYKQPANREALKAFADNKIYCIMTYWVGASDIADPENVTAGFLNMVRNWMSSPAILAWCIGNETNVGLSGDDLKNWYDLVETCAKAAHEEESAAGITFHPVTTANAEIGEIGNAVYDADDAKLAHLEFWSVQVYRGASFGNLFNDFRSRSNKPLLITEFGCDAWDGTNGREDQHTQAQIVLNQWNEIASNLATDANPSGTLLGGVVFQWRDTWNKSFTNPMGDGGHDTVADWTNAAYPDSGMNEEWWGICGVSTSSPTSRQLREVYTSLRSTWNPGPLFTASIHNISDDSPADRITWNSVPALPADWLMASQYVKIETEPDFDRWGIQLYTDNCAPDADPGFYIAEPSSCNPAGLIRVSDRRKALKMCWRITDQPLNGSSSDLAIAEQYAGQGTKLYSPSLGPGYDCYHWIKDRKTPLIPSENTTPFRNGEDYVTAWESTRGIHHRESEWTVGNSSPNYLYIGACFKDAVTPETYRGKLVIEFFIE